MSEIATVMVDRPVLVDLAAIKEALLLWEEQTCVQFKELPSPKRGEPYIEFKVGSGLVFL